MLARTGRQGSGFAGGCGCGCDGAPQASPGMGGFFSTVLNVAGSFVGDPALGDQLASQAQPGYNKINETPAQIAERVAPRVKTVLDSGALPDPTKISPAWQQLGTAVAADVAADLASQGVFFPPGTVGADLQSPSVLTAFGGANEKWVMVGGLALGALLLARGL